MPQSVGSLRTTLPGHQPRRSAPSRRVIYRATNTRLRIAARRIALARSAGTYPARSFSGDRPAPDRTTNSTVRDTDQTLPARAMSHDAQSGDSRVARTGGRWSHRSGRVPEPLPPFSAYQQRRRNRQVPRTNAVASTGDCPVTDRGPRLIFEGLAPTIDRGPCKKTSNRQSAYLNEPQPRYGLGPHS